MSEVKQVHELLDAAGIEHFMLNGVFLCSGPNGKLARISTYEDDESQFRVIMDGLTPRQAVTALSATIEVSE
jgi:hypothetical protein